MKKTALMLLSAITLSCGSSTDPASSISDSETSTNLSNLDDSTKADFLSELSDSLKTIGNQTEEASNDASDAVDDDVMSDLEFVSLTGTITVSYIDIDEADGITEDETTVSPIPEPAIDYDITIEDIENIEYVDYIEDEVAPIELIETPTQEKLILFTSDDGKLYVLTNISEVEDGDNVELTAYVIDTDTIADIEVDYLLVHTLIIDGEDSTPDVSDTPISGESAIEGTIQYYDLEGGFWGLITEDGEQYELRLSEELEATLKTGSTIYAIGEIVNEASIVQWGTIFEITEFKLIGETTGPSIGIPVPVNPIELPEEAEDTEDVADNTITGSIMYYDLENGFWGLITDDGMQYELLLSEELEATLKTGSTISVVGTVSEMITVNGWGNPLTVESFEVIDTDNDLAIEPY